jgi:hypothetical protein
MKEYYQGEQMITEDELSEFKKLINNFKPEIGEFEKKILLPEISGRVDYIYKIFEEFLAIANDSNNALIIDAAVREIADPKKIDINAPEPNVGKNYLRMIQELIKGQYLNPIDTLKAKYPLESIQNGTIDNFINYLNEVKILLNGIVFAKEKMLTMITKKLVNIKNAKTGIVEYGPPESISIILIPFELMMPELVNIASSTIDSIQNWIKKLKDQELKQIQIISDFSQMKVAQEQAKASQAQVNTTKWNIGFQISVVFVAIILVILSQPITSYIEKAIAQNAFQQTSDKLVSCQLDLKKLEITNKSNEEKLKNTIEDLNNKQNIEKSNKRN